MYIPCLIQTDRQGGKALNLKLEKIIKKYEEDISYYVKILCDSLGINNLYLWKVNDTPKQGFIEGNNIKYRFHGSGLYIEMENKTIDFDFGYKGIFGGFNMYKLFKYAQGDSELSILMDRNEFEKAFNDAKKSLEIINCYSVFGDYLEYRAKYIDNLVFDMIFVSKD